MLKCGMYEVDMTPPLGLCIPGYFDERRAMGIKEGLYAKAAVFEDGEESIAFVSLDLLHPDKDISEKIR